MKFMLDEMTLRNSSKFDIFFLEKENCCQEVSFYPGFRIPKIWQILKHFSRASIIYKQTSSVFMKI